MKNGLVLCVNPNDVERILMRNKKMAYINTIYVNLKGYITWKYMIPYTNEQAVSFRFMLT